MKGSREDLRATQILSNSWNNSGSGPFTKHQSSHHHNISYDPTDQASGHGGANYTITITTNMPLASDLW